MKKERSAIDTAVKIHPASIDGGAIEKWRSEELAVAGTR